MSPASRAAVAGLIAAAGIGGFVWWRKQQTPPPAPPPPKVEPLPAPAPPPPARPAEPAIRNPIEPAASSPGPALPPLAEADAFVTKALIDLLGRKGALSFLRVDGFARNFVATVENLATENAPAELWPVIPTAGRFEAQARAEETVIAAKNAERYAAFVRFVDGVDTRRAVGLYRRLYPLFQQAYEELGYPGRYFNDRVVEVIDHLLATPEVAGPLKVKLVEVKGGGKLPARLGGGLYTFADPALEARSAGQKIMLRVGPENGRRLKLKLADVRQYIARGSAARPPGGGPPPANR